MSRFANRLWAVGSGKGGVGKSFLTASLAAALARMGRTVIAVDAGLGAPDLHAFLGVRNFGRSLLDAIADRAPAEQALRGTCEPRVRMLACTGDAPGTADLAPQVRSQMIERIRALNADHILVDLPSGASAQVLDFFDGADATIVVSTPEPASVRRILSFLGHALERRQARRAASVTGGLPAAPALRPWLVWNMAATERDRQLAAVLLSAARRQLGVELMLAGTIAASDAVRDLARTTAFPDLHALPGEIGRQIEAAARRMLAEPGPAQRPAAPERDGASPAIGLNDSVELFGRRVHVQTEDMGPQRRRIATHVFLDGRVIHSKQAAYPEAADGASRTLIAEMMRAQHRAVIREIESRMEGSAQP